MYSRQKGVKKLIRVLIEMGLSEGFRAIRRDARDETDIARFKRVVERLDGRVRGRIMKWGVSRWREGMYLGVKGDYLEQREMAERLEEIGKGIVGQLGWKFEKNMEEEEKRRVKRWILNGWMRIVRRNRKIRNAFVVFQKRSNERKLMISIKALKMNKKYSKIIKKVETHLTKTHKTNVIKACFDALKHQTIIKLHLRSLLSSHLTHS